MMFINREKELKTLKDLSREDKPHFFIIYGKRRVGKTELLKHFIKDIPSIYFLADKRRMEDQLKELGEIVGAHFNDFILVQNGFSSWLDFFRYIEAHVRSKLVLIIDEYPYLAEVDEAISSIFQKGWDEYLKDLPIFFILCGSSISMMESEALLYKSPLYGRRTGQLFINPLSFRNSHAFFRNQSFHNFLHVYAITGGIPAYLMQFNERLSIEANIREKIFPLHAFLHNEVEFILKEELREPKTYMSILKAIAFGKRKFGEIANDTGLEKNILTKYLETLKSLFIIGKEVPITETRQEKSRKGLYYIQDNFFRFWFQYILPNKSYLEIGEYDTVMKKIMLTFDSFCGYVFESVARELVREFEKKFFHCHKIGRWWDNEHEIDLVGMNEETREIIFGEVKWSDKKIGTNILDELKIKAEHVVWNNETRKEFFILFSKSGFTDRLLEEARKENVFLVECDVLF